MPPFDFDQLWLKSGPLAPEHVAKVIWAPTLYLRGKKKNKTKKGIDFNTSAATMAEEDKKVSEVLILIPIFQYSSL